MPFGSNTVWLQTKSLFRRCGGTNWNLRVHLALARFDKFGEAWSDLFIILGALIGNTALLVPQQISKKQSFTGQIPGEWFSRVHLPLPWKSIEHLLPLPWSFAIWWLLYGKVLEWFFRRIPIWAGVVYLPRCFLRSRIARPCDGIYIGTISVFFWMAHSSEDDCYPIHNQLAVNKHPWYVPKAASCSLFHDFLATSPLWAISKFVLRLTNVATGAIQAVVTSSFESHSVTSLLSKWFTMWVSSVLPMTTFRNRSILPCWTTLERTNRMQLRALL